MGILHLPRQVLQHPDGSGHVLPGNELLPEHGGMVITRSLREWACLLPLDVGVESHDKLYRNPFQSPLRPDELKPDLPGSQVSMEDGYEP